MKKICEDSSYSPSPRHNKTIHFMVNIFLSQKVLNAQKRIFIFFASSILCSIKRSCHKHIVRWKEKCYTSTAWFICFCQPNFQALDLTPAQELPLDLQHHADPALRALHLIDRVLWEGGLADTTLRVQPTVWPVRRPPCCDLVGNDDEAAAANHAKVADVAIPCLAVLAEAGRYASPVLAAAAAWHDILKICEYLVFLNFWRICEQFDIYFFDVCIP